MVEGYIAELVLSSCYDFVDKCCDFVTKHVSVMQKLRKYIVFGHLVQGNEVLKKIENVGDEEGIPTVTVKIINYGEVIEDKRKNKLRMGKDASYFKRGKYRRGKKREKRREKKRKRRDKRSKRKSRRASDSLTDDDSESSSENSSDNDDQGKPQKHEGPSQKSVGNQSPSATERANPHIKTEVAGLVKECEAPRENGEQKSKGIEEDAKSDRSAERQPDGVDDRPSKSRFPFVFFFPFFGHLLKEKM